MFFFESGDEMVMFFISSFFKMNCVLVVYVYIIFWYGGGDGFGDVG